METVISSETQVSPPTQEVKTVFIYPDSDGEPVANNTEHLDHIIATKLSFEHYFKDRDDVFVASDLLWYPVEGNAGVASAPDVMIIVGRPKGSRKSYKQWEEGGIAPQVVFEFLSESNSVGEMARKAEFFDTYGVQEYYIYDMRRKKLTVSIRYKESDFFMDEIADMKDWTSPRLGIRITVEEDGLKLYKPDGTMYPSYEEYLEMPNLLENAQLRANQETKRANEENKRANEEQQRANEERQRANEERQRADALAAKLRELGINPDTFAL